MDKNKEESDHKTCHVSELDIPYVKELNLEDFDNYESSLEIQNLLVTKDEWGRPAYCLPL